MTNVAITKMGAGRFGVEIEEGGLRTGHLVEVPPDLIDDLGLFEVDQTDLVRESVGFLLDREPATSIAEELSLDEIPARFPDYYDELKVRLSAG